ncbi:MAG: formate dehydrogenase accessory sulfurtransferase FdhD [Pyrinomonadaceae bacterium]
MPTETGLTEADVRRVGARGEVDDLADVIAVEEPLEIRIGLRVNGKLEHRAISITMRTPGDDFSLAAGFLFTEGIVKSPAEVAEIKYCRSIADFGLRIADAKTGADSKFQIPNSRSQISNSQISNPKSAIRNPQSNTVRVDLADGVHVDFKKLERHFYTTSSCGVCGKSSIEALHTGATKIDSRSFEPVGAEVIHRLPSAALAAQLAFEKTGGLHASVLFDREGKIDTVCEDVGRHNALDKAIGRKFLIGETPLSDRILLVSGRASFELVQKALMAGIPILAAVGAPSSLAVELASEFGMTLIGFVREERFNIYTGAERVRSPANGASF